MAMGRWARLRLVCLECTKRGGNETKWWSDIKDLGGPCRGKIRVPGRGLVENLEGVCKKKNEG